MKVPTLSALLSERERKMIRFECDYAEGMHPRILERLQAKLKQWSEEKVVLNEV